MKQWLLNNSLYDMVWSRDGGELDSSTFNTSSNIFYFTVVKPSVAAEEDVLDAIDSFRRSR